MILNFTILITAPPLDRQGAYTAYHFCQAAITKGHTINQIFFYGAGVYNANCLSMVPSDEINLVQLWQIFAKQNACKLYVCVATAQRRGILDSQETAQLQPPANLAEPFIMTGLGQLIEAINFGDRFITFN